MCLQIEQKETMWTTKVENDSRCKVSTIVKKNKDVDLKKKKKQQRARLVHSGHLTEVSGSQMSWILHRERVAPQRLLWKQGQEV